MTPRPPINEPPAITTETSDLGTDPTRPGRAALQAFLIWTGAFLLTRLWWIAAPFCNLECAFSQAAHALALSSERARLDYYWEYQANPLGYPILAAPLIALTGLHDSYWLVRIPSLLSMVLLLGVAAAAWARADRRDVGGLHAWLACLAFQPFFWLFGAQSTSDLMVVSLLHASMLLCWIFVSGASRDPRPQPTAGRFGAVRALIHPLGGMLFALAVLCKPTAILASPGFFYIVAFGSRRPESDGGRDLRPMWRRLPPLGWYTIWPGMLLGAYAWWIYINFGIFLIPQQYRERHAQLNDLPTTLVVWFKYLAFLAMFLGFLGPAGLIPRLRKMSRSRLAIALALAIGAAIPIYLFVTPVEVGEMNFGTANHLASPELFRLAETAAAVLGVALLVDVAMRAVAQTGRFPVPQDPSSPIDQGARTLARYFLASFIPMLLVASTTRPAQRYLMLVLPLLIGLILLGNLRNHRRLRAWVVIVMLVLFVSVDLIGGSFMAGQGQASLNMARKIEALGLLGKTDPGPVGQHTRQYFPIVIDIEKAPYQVVEQSASEPLPDASVLLAHEEIRFLGHPFRRYVLIRKPAPPRR